MEKYKGGENGQIDGWRRLEKYKYGRMKDGDMDLGINRRQEWLDIWTTPAREAQKQPFERLIYG